MDAPPILIIPRHGGDELRVGLGEYNGHKFLSLRTYFDAGDGIMRPTKKGVSVPLSSLGALGAAIQQAQRQVTGPTASTVASLAAHRALRDAEQDADVIDSHDPTEGPAA